MEFWSKADLLCCDENGGTFLWRPTGDLPEVSMMDGGRFPEGSTTGVLNDEKKRGVNIKIIVRSDCYGKWATVYI